MPDFTLFRDFGLVGVMAGSITILLFLVVKWTLQTTKEILRQAEKERECWRGTIDAINKTIDNHNSRAQEFHSSVQEAHKYQRDEHEKMIKNLDEQYKVLLRINGEKYVQ